MSEPSSFTITSRPFITLETPTLKVCEAVAGQVITSDRDSGLRSHMVFDGPVRQPVPC
jgi:hypothetical protein